MSYISDKSTLTVGPRALITDAYDIAFERLFLTPAKPRVNTKLCSNDFICQVMYFTYVILSQTGSKDGVRQWGEEEKKVRATSPFN